MSIDDRSDRTLTFSRVINAPRDLVWRAFTEPEHLKQWWGPDGFTNTFFEFNMTPGGTWRFMMHGPDGTDYPNKIVFREVVEKERLIYDHSGDGEMADSDHRFIGTITLEDTAEGTKVTLSLAFETVEEFTNAATFGATEGGKQTLGRLAEHVATM